MSGSKQEIDILKGEKDLAEHLIKEITEKVEELNSQRERMVFLSDLYTRSLKKLREGPVHSVLVVESEE